MQRIRPALTQTRRRHSAAVALFFSLASCPVLASSGIDPVCDDSDPLTSLADELITEAVDHAPSVGSTSMRLGIVDQSPPRLASATPRVDRILRQIFDETPPDNADSGDAAARSTAAPLVELKTPDLIDEARDRFRRAAPESQTDVPTPLVDPRFPGLSDADAERYRRQMYRTDI